MRFAEIIREAGYEVTDFPKCSELSINLYDRKNRLITSETISFAEPLFKNNHDEHEKFGRFLKWMEEKDLKERLIEKPFNVQITVDAVIVWYPSYSTVIFLRNVRDDWDDWLERLGLPV